MGCGLSPVARAWSASGLPAGTRPRGAPGWMRSQALGHNVPFQHHLLPFAASLPICAHPLVSQRIILKNWHVVQGQRLQSCGLPGPGFGVLEAADHKPCQPYLHEAGELTQLDRPVCLLLPTDRRARSAVCICKLPGQRLLFPFIFASAACRLKRHLQEADN